MLNNFYINNMKIEFKIIKTKNRNMSWLQQAFLESEAKRCAETVCFYCNATGHYKNECPERMKQIQCFRCSAYGHIKRQCKAPVCYACGGIGHIQKFCKNVS